MKIFIDCHNCGKELGTIRVEGAIAVIFKCSICNTIGINKMKDEFGKTREDIEFLMLHKLKGGL